MAGAKQRQRRDYGYGSRAFRKGKRSAAHSESGEELEEVGDAVKVTNSSMEPRWPEVEDDVDPCIVVIFCSSCSSESM